MSLQNLHTVFEKTQAACSEVSLTSIPNLPQKFKDDYAKLIVEDTSFSRNDRIVWGRDGSAELWSRGKRTRIYVPSVGFFIAWHLVPLYRELISYRTILSTLLEAHGKALSEIEEPDCVPYIEATTSLSQAEKGYLKKFVTDGSWWGKGRQISRAQDFFESPLMQCARLTQETQSEIARITKQLSENPTLLDSLNGVATKPLFISSKRPCQLIIYGAPGTGKSWRIKNDTKGMSVIRTTFHPDSDYSTFVGAYKPSMEDDDFKTVVMTGEIGSAGNITKKDGLVTKKRIVYSFRSQAFLDAYVAAWRNCAAYLAATDEDSSKKATQFLVIEEINRGNCAQIFGDIFQLLDREDDGYSSYAINADNDLGKFVADSFKGDAVKGIPALDLTGVDMGDRDITPNEIASGDKLLLPPNLYIWATMNTSDQSLFPIDSAFKRRWAWKYIPISNANKNYSIKVGSDKYDWWTFLDKANTLVESFTESEDKKLGYFFCKADNIGVISLEQFVGKVVFYLWNGVFKDTGFDDEVFDDGKGGKLYFKTFFNDNGDPNPESVKQFMKNLGIGAAASTAGNAGDADGGATTEPPAGSAENTEGQGQ